ncbi:HWE histidine kinase domain-containing protein [Albidovulum sp.]|uniref:HWE histidine kinase domain-containing protein n=1 Tax=Albidovulum sp. TaxID=1872424 RepID=UPI0039B9C423
MEGPGRAGKWQAQVAGAGRALRTPGNASSSLLLSLIDATKRIQRDLARDILFGELKHRIRNLLAVTQSIARRTRVEGQSAEEYREDLLGRLRALSEAHVLAFGGADDDRLSTLADRILAPYKDRHAIVIEHDDDPALDSDRPLALGLVLHELATNAVKYGALSAPGSRVHIGGKVDPATQVLRLDWNESGGQP